jgi:hypothetical protein
MPAEPVAPVETAQPLLVPDVRGLPLVFAKGVLEDAGFAWKIDGKVKGYAVNLVAGQNALGALTGTVFLNGKLVHYTNGKVKPVGLQKSLLVFADLERLFGTGFLADGRHDPMPRAKWLRMAANEIGHANRKTTH